MPRDDQIMPDTTPTDKTPATDIPLFRSRKLSPYTRERIAKGTDIYLKVDENKETSFYILHWTEEENGRTTGSEDDKKVAYSTVANSEEIHRDFFSISTVPISEEIHRDRFSISTVPISEECAIRLLRGLVIMPDTRSGVEFGNILKHVPGYFRSVKRSLDVVHVVQDDSCRKYFEMLNLDRDEA